MSIPDIGEQDPADKGNEGNERNPSIEQPTESRNIYWSLDEDLLLVSAWLNTSKDPSAGDDQDRFWGKVTEYFAKYSPPGARVRREKTISSRWYRTTQLVSNFAAIFKEVVQLNPSGKSFGDMLVDAHALYLGRTGKKFGLEHMWRALCNEDKWASHALPSGGGTSKRVKIDEMGAHSDSPTLGSQDQSTNVSITHGSHDQSTNINVMEHEQIHPIGKKTAKRKAKGKGTISVDDVSERMSSLGQTEAERNEILRKYVTIQEEKVEVIKEALRLRCDMKKMKEQEYEIKVMSKDTSSMPALEAAFWQARKDEIMRKYDQAPQDDK